MIEHISHFVLASVLVLASWAVYLFLNEWLDKMNSGFVQEILGTAMTFGLFMAVGVVLYFFSYGFFMGWFLVFIAWLAFAGVRRLLRPAARGASGPAAN